MPHFRIGRALDQQLGAGTARGRREHPIAPRGSHLVGKSGRLGQAGAGGDHGSGGGIVPGFGDDSMCLGIGSGGDGGEPGGRERAAGHAAVRQKRALLHEATESTGSEQTGESGQIIGTKLLGHQKHEELRPRGEGAEPRGSQ